MQTVKESQYKSTRMWFTILICVGAFLFMIGGYYVYTTTASSPTAMRLFLPKDSGNAHENLVRTHGALTFILDKNDLIYYYEGELAEDGSNIKKSNFKNIREVIVKMKESTDEKEFVVVIKPTSAASYTNTVDILDEMTLNDVKRYAMVAISPFEESMIKGK